MQAVLNFEKRAIVLDVLSEQVDRLAQQTEQQQGNMTNAKFLFHTDKIQLEDLRKN